MQLNKESKPIYNQVALRALSSLTISHRLSQYSSLFEDLLDTIQCPYRTDVRNSLFVGQHRRVHG